MGHWARRREDRLLGGVCAGIGEASQIDPTLIRLGFLLLSLAWGIGLVLYSLLWVLLPEEGSPARGLGVTARQNLAAIPGQVASSARAVSKRMLCSLRTNNRDSWRRQDRRSWPRPLGRRWIAIALIGGGSLVVLASLGAFAWLTPLRAAGLAAICGGGAALINLRGG